jgi:FeS assembly SUF system regulator
MVLFSIINHNINIINSMLRINKLTDYALLISGEMARAPAEVQSATRLNCALQLSLPTVSKILKLLADASLIESVRGAKGGYRLSLQPEKISLLAIMTAIEGPLTLTECAKDGTHCHLSARCQMRANWLKINKHIVSIFEKITLSDMIKPESSFIARWGVP